MPNDQDLWGKSVSHSGNKLLDLLRGGASDDDVIHINKKEHSELFFTIDEEWAVSFGDDETNR